MTEKSKRTMKELSHTNPYTGESAGQLFRRGPVVAADGGERDAVSRDSSEQRSDGGERDAYDESAEEDAEAETEAEADDETMKDVSHTPPNESEDANRVFERGGKERAVEE